MITPRRCLLAAFAMLSIGIIPIVSGCARDDAPPPILSAAQPCPQWVEFPASNHSNADSPYLGCSSAANLRATLDNPADIERGRPTGPASGERETLAVEAYRQGKVKPFEGTSASGSGSTQSGSTGSSTSGSP